MERAVISRGKYKFQKEFKNLEVAEDDWFKMSGDQRERHLKKVAQANVSKEVNQIACQLPVSSEKFHTGLKLPLSVIQGIWKEASELVSNPTAISAAPGYGTECRMVMSKLGKRPHLVSKGKSLGKFSCDNNCPNWK